MTTGKAADRCYAVRRLNPFLGVVQVVDIDGARALSGDGLSWQIQVLTERPEHTWGSLNQHPPTQQYFRFGAWSAQEGLVRVPVSPLLDIGAMLAAVDRLLPPLRARLAELPFPLRDRYELWLLDDENRPLALLGSTHEERFIPEIPGDPWHANPPAGPAFVSETLSAQGLAAVDSAQRQNHARYLERLVRQRSGPNDGRQWFHRREDGSGLGLAHRVPTELAARILPATAFPRLTLRTDWSDPTAAAVVRDYLDWCAPRLLTLTTLTESERDRLEHAARGQAELVDRQYRLYPRILNPALVDAARVEARLRRTAESV